jgi:hypothetical protein
MMLTEPQIQQRNEVYRHGREFLRTLLVAGPLPYRTIVARATEAGIPLATLLTAKCWLHVEARKIDKSTIWSLPPDP